MSRCIYLIVLLSVISNLLSAQNDDYVILRMTADVNVKYRGSDRWEPLKERDAVTLFDVIDLVGDGSVSIMKKSTRTVYSTVDTEPMTVYDIVKRAENKHLGIVRNVAKEAVSTNSTKKPDVSSYGASVRGQVHTGSTDDVYAAVCSAVNMYFSDGSISGQNPGLSLTRVYDGELYSLCITNNTEYIQYVNIVCVDTVSPAFRLCYPFEVTPVAAAGEKTFLPGDYFDAEGVFYLLVASTENFDSSLLDMNLRKRLAPKSETIGTSTVNIETR